MNRNSRSHTKKKYSLKKLKSRPRISIAPSSKLKKPLLVYVIENKFHIVKQICRELNYRVTSKRSQISEADLIWNESSSDNISYLSQIKNHQKLNHFPGISSIIII